MNGRTCLLCGKSLPRIWVGAGEDFCSREHRNQYQLRRGMDRLLEANTVATLARKRETPKLIQQTSRPSASPLSNRGFLDAQHPPAPPAKPFTAKIGSLLRPHMVDSRGRWLTRPLPGLPDDARHPAPNAVRFK